MHAKMQAQVGRNIRRFRLEDGLTLEEMAFRAHLHYNYLGDLERGRRNPSLANLKKIADGLKRPITDLFTNVNPAPTAATKEKTPLYFPPEDKDLLALVKTLRSNSPKDRKHIIKIAKAMSARLKKG